MNALWWRTLPAWLHRRWPLGTAILLDGRYLARWPWIGALAPLVALLSGATLGIVLARRGFVPLPFTGSLAAMAAMVLVGFLSAALGGALVVGYALATVVHAGTVAWELGLHNRAAVALRSYGALPIAWALLAGAIVLSPMVVRRVAHRIRTRTGLTTHPPQAVVVLGSMLAAAILTSAWALVAPVVIRPWYTWRGHGIARDAMIPVQRHGVWLVVVAAAACLIRAALERIAATRPTPVPLAQPLDFPPSRPRRPLPVPVAMLVRSLVAAYLLAGLASNWSEWAILASIFLLSEIARGVMGSLPSWIRAVARIPIPLRAAAIVATAVLFGWLIVKPMWGNRTLLPLIYSLAPTLLVAALLAPKPATGSAPVAPTASR